jgi:hypothetical protein
MLQMLGEVLTLGKASRTRVRMHLSMVVDAGNEMDAGMATIRHNPCPPKDAC